MKRIRFFAMAFLCAACVMSCSDKDDVQKDMKADDQKSFLEDVAIEFTQKVPASDFEGLKTFAEDISYVFDEDYWTEVEVSLLNDFFMSMVFNESEFVDSTTTPGSYIYGYEEFTDIVLALANFTGHFVASDSGWVYSESDVLQFDFEDANEKACVLKVAQEGNITTFLLPRDEDEDWDDSDEEEIFYYYKSTGVTICVPEKVIISLTQDGKDVVKATFTPKITNLTEDGFFDVGKTNILMGADFELNNGYKTSFKAEESPNKKLSVSCDLSNATGKLISYTLSSDPSGIPSYVLENVDDLGDTLEQSEDLNAKNLYICFSVLDKAQAIGRIADLNDFVTLSDELDDESEEEYKKTLAEINKLIDMGLYYNGSTDKQARLELEAQYRSDTHGGRTEEWWEVIPVMVFSDGARISCEDFFDEEGFSKAIEAFEALEAQYDNLFDD
ncbi:MAG: hypothetical protein J6W18_09185 [Bacteroidaceae bacterium]|nr:hypothetical protein [Bacteroidaceae bacterium]